MSKLGNDLTFEEFLELKKNFLDGKKEIEEASEKCYLTENGDFYIGFVKRPIRYITNKTGRKYARIYVPGLGECHLNRLMIHVFVDKNFPIKYEKGCKKVVNYKNGDPTDNRLENLQVLSQSENIKKAIYEDNKSTGKGTSPCIAYNVKTGEIREYPSTVKLCEDIFKSSNAGYFNRNLKLNSTTRDGWKVKYV